MFQDSAMENKSWPNGTTGEPKSVNRSDVSGAVSKQNRNWNKKRDNVVPWNGLPVPTGGMPPGQRNPKSNGPKPRTGHSGYGTHRKNDHKMTDDSCDPDLDSLIPSKGKKQNLAHLLKFQLTPRDSLTSSYWHATHSSGNNGSKHFYKHGRNSHMNKDQYLQANCQFVVKVNEDYSMAMVNPDLLVPWDYIEQIRIWGSEAETGTCPICLHTPVAARMTRCGHIYCWSCILHFLALSDKTSRPCPICDVAVRIPDLRSVITLEQRQFRVGDEIEMTLMKRDRHSLQPQPLDQNGQAHQKYNIDLSKPMQLKRNDENSVFSKLLLCTPRDVIDLILSFEKLELQKQWEEEKECPESCFIQQALDLLAAREDSILQEAQPISETDAGIFSSEKHEDSGNAIAAGYSVERDNNVACDQACSTGDGAEDLIINPPSSPVAPVPDVQSHQQHKNVFYFYQSSDGQSIYMHPINVQMLVHCYGSLEKSPQKISGRIVEIETFSMTEELRNRLRYLGHVPLAKSFQVTEIALSENTIDSLVVKEFKHQVEERERRRKHKEIEESRRSREIQRKEDAKWGRSLNKPIAVRLDSQLHFPGFSPTDDPALSFEEEGVLGGSPSSSTEQQFGSKEENNGPSFAQMLREGKNKVPVVWPSLSEKAKLAPAIKSYRNRDSESGQEDEFSPVPDYKDTFSSVLAAAFDTAAKSTDVEGKEVQTRKGKKKSKQKLLFSTGMNFLQ